MLQFLLRHISFRIIINLGDSSPTMNENSPQKMFMTWEKDRSLRNLSLSVIIMVLKWNSVSVVTASSLLITPNNHNKMVSNGNYVTLCLAPNKVTISHLREKNYFYVGKKRTFTAPVLRKWSFTWDGQESWLLNSFKLCAVIDNDR